MKKSFLFFLLFLVACASPSQNDKKDHQLFLLKVEEQKRHLPPKEYQNYLKQELKRKQGELDALRGVQGGERKQLGHYEVMANPGASNHPQNVHDFQAQSSKIKLKQLHDKIKMVEREVFFLQSQIK